MYRVLKRLSEGQHRASCARSEAMSEARPLSALEQGRSITRFRADRSGNVVIMFSLSLIPILFLGGMGIDYGTNLAVRQKVQNAVDGTALTLAKLPSTVTDAELVTRADAQVHSMVADGRLFDFSVVSKRVGDTIVVTATGKTQTTLTRLGGFTSLGLEVTGIVRRGAGNLEVALVLDNTGSMGLNGKIGNLKTAAKDFVAALYSETDPDQPNSLKIAVVPFSMTVNIGASNLGANFLDTNALSSTHTQIFGSDVIVKNRFELFKQMGISWGGCVESRPAPYDIDGTPPTKANAETLFVPFFAPDESDLEENTNPGRYPPAQYWPYFAINNYMDDYPASTSSARRSDQNRVRQERTAKYSRNSLKKSGAQPGTGYTYGPNAGCELTPITRLTTTRSTVDTAIDAMKVIGDTNIPMGLTWGWHVLSPDLPFRDGAAYSEKNATVPTTKYVVLMTDGQNASAVTANSNNSVYSGLGYSWQGRVGTTSNDTDVRRQRMDDRLTLLCENMKKTGIQIFTVRVEVAEGTNEVLKNCASQESMFFDVQNSSGLTAVFRSIGAQINDLRISG